MSHHQHNCHNDQSAHSCRCREKQKKGSKSNELADNSNVGNASLSLAQIITKIEDLGYTDHSTIIREDGRYKIITQNAKGDAAELYVYIQSGDPSQNESLDKQEEEIIPADEAPAPPVKKQASAKGSGNKHKKKRSHNKAAQA